MSTFASPVLRPKQAAAYIGMSVPSFWCFAKDDPTFPRLFKIGPQATAIMRADLDAWIAAKREAAQ